MGRNLGPLNIKDSYEGLVQISGSDQLTDGSGSLISSLDVNAATATSASHAVNSDTAISASFATTASFALNAGASTLQEVLDNSNEASADIVLTGSYQRVSGSFSGTAIDNITDTYTGTEKIQHVITLTQAEYDALSPDADTFYVITDADATMTTGSVSDATLTFTKDDGTTFDLVVDNVANATSASFALTASSLEGGVSLQTVLDTGNTATQDINLTGDIDVAGIAVFGASNNSTTDNTGNGVFGGDNNQITTTDPAGRNAILGGTGNTVAGNQQQVIVGGQSNNVSNIRTGIFNGNGASITAGNATIIGSGGSSTISGGSLTLLAGGRANTISGGNNNAILAGSGSTVSHNQSVTIGGTGLSTTADNQVVMPNVVATAINATSITASNASFTSASIGYLQSITGSAKIIGDAFIILNNDTPTERYAGIVVQDSGSTNNTASLEFDGQTNDWFYEYTDDGGVTTDHGVAMFGPEYNTKGSPTYPTANTLVKGNGGHHLEDSNITDDGTTISLGSDTAVDGTMYVDATAETYAFTASLQSGESFRLGYHSNGPFLESGRTNSVMWIGTPTINNSITIGRNNAIGFYGDAFEPGTKYSFGNTQARWEVPVSSSNYISASAFIGDGSQLQNLPSSDPFPYTGDAEITGSLRVLGEMIAGAAGNDAFGTNSVSIGGSGNDATQTNAGTFAGEGNTASGIRSATIGGFGNTAAALLSFTGGGRLNAINSGADKSAIVGGESHIISNDWGFIGGGNNHTMPGLYGGAVGGRSLTIDGIDNVVLGGLSNSIGGEDGAILSGRDNTISNGEYNSIVAGRGNTINTTSLYSGIVGGNNNTIAGHDRSVILGGLSLSTTKDDEVVVPNLTVKGNVVQDVNTITVTSNTGSLDASLGSLFEITLGNGVDTQLEIENQVAGQTLQLKITNNATAAGTISFDPQFEFEGGTAFEATAATSAVDILTLTTFDGTSVQCVGAKNFS